MFLQPNNHGSNFGIPIPSFTYLLSLNVLKNEAYENKRNNIVIQWHANKGMGILKFNPVIKWNKFKLTQRLLQFVIGEIIAETSCYKVIIPEYVYFHHIDGVISPIVTRGS